MSTGKNWFSLTIITSPTLISLHFFVTKFPSSPRTLVGLSFSSASLFYRTLSSKKSFIPLTAITKSRGGKLVGLPPVIDIGLIIYRQQITMKYRLAGFNNWWRKFNGRNERGVYLLVLITLDASGIESVIPIKRQRLATLIASDFRDSLLLGTVSISNASSKTGTLSNICSLIVIT